jgi:hypothetical protein
MPIPMSAALRTTEMAKRSMKFILYKYVIINAGITKIQKKDDENFNIANRSSFIKTILSITNKVMKLPAR